MRAVLGRVRSARKTFVLAAAAALASLTLAACSSDPPLSFPELMPGGGLSGYTPSQVLSIATSAAERQGSVRIVSVEISGGQRFDSVYDVDRSKGKQTISGASGTATILVLPGVGYQRGDATFLQSSEGFPPAAAAALAGRWISFRPGQPGYRQVVAGDTLGSALTDATPTGQLSLLAPTTINGQQVVGVSGSVSADQVASGATGTAVLYVSETSPHLPVESVEHLVQNNQPATSTMTFSRWGQTVTVVAPSQSTPITSLTSPGS